MKLRLRQFATSLILISLLTCVLAVNSASTQNAETPAAQANALNTLSEYLVGNYDTAGKLLKKYNYVPPPAIASSWRGFPAVRKLEYAYLAAETATPRSGGDKLLALLSQKLVEQYESVRSDNVLGNYVKAEPVIEPPAFKNPSPLPQRINLDARVNAALDALADYYVRGPLGSPQRVLRKYFNLSDSDAFQVLSQSNTDSEAFKRAMDRVPREQRLSTLEKLTNDLKAHYQGLAYEAALASLKLVEPPPEISLTTPVRPTVPERLGSIPSAQDRFGLHMGTTYRDAASREFTVMASSFRGFGGVVFGNEVKADVGSARPFSIFIEETDTPGLVTVWCHFLDGSMAGLPNVRAADAYAAAEIYYPSQPHVSSPNPGEGVGLVGVEDAVPYVECETFEDALRRGKQFNVVMHPALEDLDLAWSALTVDTAPIEPEVLVQKSKRRKHPSAEPASEAIERLFNSLESQTEISLGTWKVVDVPMTISRKGNVLSISRTAGGTPDFPEGLRKEAFLEMRNMTVSKVQALLINIYGDAALSTNEYDLDFANEFYRLLPILTRVSIDYAVMNRFAPVLAFFRWARSQRAQLVIPPNRPMKIETPDAVLVYDGSVKAINPFKELDAYKASLRTVTACIEKAEQSTAFAEFQQAAEPILQRGSSQVKTYRAAPPNSPAAKQALEEIDRVVAKLESMAVDKPQVLAWLDLMDMSDLIENRISDLEAEARRRERRKKRNKQRVNQR
jgi:hypothetical protein